MKKFLSLALLFAVLLYLLPAERLVLTLVAHVPPRPTRSDDTFTLDHSDENLALEVFGAEKIDENLYRATQDNVVLQLTGLF